MFRDIYFHYPNWVDPFQPAIGTIPKQNSSPGVGPQAGDGIPDEEADSAESRHTLLEKVRRSISKLPLYKSRLVNSLYISR